MSLEVVDLLPLPLVLGVARGWWVGERRAGARARDASPPSFLEKGRESWKALVNRKREREA